MNWLYRIKKTVEYLPPSIGIKLNGIPFKYRLGKEYKIVSSTIDQLIMLPIEDKLEYINSSFNNIKNHFIHNSSFYKSIIGNNEIINNNNLPILKKEHFKRFSIEERTVFKYASRKYNTGGTSGNPLQFYADKNFYAREWAHMHYMWRKIGYNHFDTKITIRGKNIKGIYRYNFNQNEFLINAYHNWQIEDLNMLLDVLKKYNVKFIHGYPSAIFSFLKKIEIISPRLLQFLQRNIKGLMLGSEYPLPKYRSYIENLLTTNTISWYGHTEGVILAGELYEKYEYIPFLSYGYGEAISIDNYYHLVGTSFANKATPFIRYDTEDLIFPTFSAYGILEKFKIKEGRIGEFIKDKNGNLISVTALIFGHHHALFDVADFIQIQQVTEGELIIYFSAREEILNPQRLFDSENVDINFKFQQYEEPIRTALGKAPLLIK